MLERLVEVIPLDAAAAAEVSDRPRDARGAMQPAQREPHLAAAQLEKTGTTQALLEGNHLHREPNGWRVEQLELVPCECDFTNPSWSITSSLPMPYPIGPRE